jgi:nucleotide-binding universal stress UspA family protein
MMVKRILLPLDTSAYSEAATEYAIRIAKNTGAQVDGMVVLDIPGIEKSIGPVAMGALYWADKLEKKKAEEAHAHIQTLLDKFKSRCKAEGVVGKDAEYQGSPSELISKQSIYYDLVIMGLRTHYEFGSDNKNGNTLDKILGNTITPILAVPDTYKSIENGNLLIAFDGSLPAARALQRSVQLAVHEKVNIRILNSSDEKEEGESLLTGARSYAAAYLDQDIETIWTPGKIIETVDNEFLDSTDLFVVGTHSKDGFLDFIVGSLTKHLIEYGKTPLFIG